MNKVIDRVPTYAGRIQLIVVNADLGIYDMVRADEPTVVGTPINAELFESIAADLAKISPPIVESATHVANSRNVAFYSNLKATGLESGAALTTTNYMTSVLPLNCTVFCSVAAGDAVILSDLPAEQGTLLLMKGGTAENRGGLFCAKEGGVYAFIRDSWRELCLTEDVPGNPILSINGLEPDEYGNLELDLGLEAEDLDGLLPETAALDFSRWDYGSFTETLVDGTIIEHKVTFNGDGNVTAIDNIQITG